MNSLIKYTVAILLGLTGSLLWPGSAFAAKPARDVDVTAADPDFALQGGDLDVTIIGSGFDRGSTVRFLVGELEDDTQVEVSGKILFVKENGKPDKLIVPIHVLNAALLDFYDVEVTTSSGRRGKGTGLFSVKKFNDTESRSEKGTTECNDGIDNDGDGKIDGEDDDCFGSFKPNRDGGGRGKDLPLIAILDPDGAGNDLQFDVDEPYVHGEKHVKALAGDPRLRRIRVQTGGHGGNIREVHVSLQCTAIPPSSVGGTDGIDNCNALGTDGVFDFTGGYIFSVIPYLVNCPNNTPPDTSPCHDVFTMGVGEGGAQLMSFKLFSGVSPTIEAASNIGGSSIVDPGNCLAMLTEAQREAFLMDYCADDPAACNVTVTAADIIDPDGANDDWMIDGIGIKALICAVDTLVYGQTTLNIGYHVFKK
jgi:hypothetical protein